MENNLPFPNGLLNPILRTNGWQESDIMDIREMLLEEIKRQNKENGFITFKEDEEPKRID